MKTGLIKRYKDKIVGVTSSIIADNFMGARKNRRKVVEYRQLADDMNLAKQAGKNPDGGDYRDPVFRARANVSNFKTRMQLRAKQ